MCRQRATYHWKGLDVGYNVASDLITIGGLHAKLCAPKVAGIPVVRISGLSLGSPKTKSHLDVAPVERRRVYYKGEGDGFLQVWAVVSFVCPSWPWFVLTPKVFQLCTNHFVLVLCRSVWVIEARQFFLVPSWSSTTPLYPSIVLRAKEQTRLLALPLFSVWDSHLNPSRSWEHVTSYITKMFPRFGFFFNVIKFKNYNI